MKKQKVVDLRKVKRHPLYQEFNEYFTELFSTYPNLQYKIIKDAEELRSDMEARFVKFFNRESVARSLEAYGEELTNGSYQVNRADFYLPQNNN